MTNVYSASGTVFQRNEFMKGYSDYERSWPLSDVRFMASSSEEATEKVRRYCNVHEDQYGLIEIHDLQITDLGELATEGSISLQTGRPYNCTTLISVPARNIRSAEDEGFIPMRGAMRCEVTYQGESWHAKKHDISAEWFLDCKIGVEPETRKRGRIALEADQTPDLALYE
jgi:hypothetical protein